MQARRLQRVLRQHGASLRDPEGMAAVHVTSSRGTELLGFGQPIQFWLDVTAYHLRFWLDVTAYCLQLWYDLALGGCSSSLGYAQPKAPGPRNVLRRIQCRSVHPKLPRSDLPSGYSSGWAPCDVDCCQACP